LVVDFMLLFSRDTGQSKDTASIEKQGSWFPTSKPTLGKVAVRLEPRSGHAGVVYGRCGGHRHSSADLLALGADRGLGRFGLVLALSRKTVDRDPARREFPGPGRIAGRDERRRIGHPTGLNVQVVYSQARAAFDAYVAQNDTQARREIKKQPSSDLGQG
jgi:hypothetical protein